MTKNKPIYAVQPKAYALEDTVKNLWRILDYEFQMYYGVEFLQSSDIRNRPKDPELLTAFHFVMTSALTEIKILHTRVLTEIFLKRKLDDDLNIDDLIPEWRRDHLSLVEALNLAYTSPLSTGKSPKWHLDKFLAHATKSRGEGFDWKPITRTMDPPLRVIFSTLPAEHLPVLAYFRDR